MFNPLRSVQSGAALSSLAMSVPTILMVSWFQVSRFQLPCWDLDRADRCRVRSRRSVKPRRTHDGRRPTCRAVFLARRVGGDWSNEGAVVRRLERPVVLRLAVKTLVHEDTQFTRLRQLHQHLTHTLGQSINHELLNGLSIKNTARSVCRHKLSDQPNVRIWFSKQERLGLTEEGRQRRCRRNLRCRGDNE